ncbi:hypothetical protein NEOLEDRAFT_1135465 [Neolentinus lepideus HHB14362 ss-1]|uniref:Uncharacterized protein n=1 Tax=Neolentinus lepideus HHB14362 ss-1 TaxID=1314782 RepID=A0A165RU40_9AGAM|nr:hypothetical protein NEOLEDRAFT_1135465 [Neolentinus lepideus HHB14362 ss-1]
MLNLESEYLPNYGRPHNVQPPPDMSLDYPDPDTPLPVYLHVHPELARRFSHHQPTTRDLHWSIDWWVSQDLLKTVQSTWEVLPDGSKAQHLTNWGPITRSPTRAMRMHAKPVLIAIVPLEKRNVLCEIARTQLVRLPDGEYNCQNFTEEILREAVQRGVFEQGDVERALEEAKNGMEKMTYNP